MINPNILTEEEISELLEQKKYSALQEIITELNPSDIAVLLESLPEKSIPLVFRLLPKELAAETFVEMDSDNQEFLIHSLSDRELKAVIDELYMDDAADLVEEMPANVVRRILAQADPETRKTINEILNYPEDSAGSIMTTEYVSLRTYMTVSAAIAHIRHVGIDRETVNTCYVLDDKRTLLGTLSIRDLILSEDDVLCGDIMEDNPIFVVTTEDQETVAQMFSKYNFLVLPVVDKERRMLGIVTVDDAIDVMEEEATEDIERMAAITASDPDKPYIKTGVFDLWKSRIPWLLLLMISSAFTGMIITRFESALSAAVVLTAYIPMLMGTGGNSGSQSSVTVIRSLSLNELEFKDYFRVLFKESRVAILCGVTLALCNFIKMMIFDRLGLMVSAVVSLSLACTVFVAKIVGCSLPMLAKKIGFDPAVMASPFITTIVDALSLLIYFTLATMLMGI